MTPAHSVGTKDGTSEVTPKSALKEAVERVTARLRRTYAKFEHDNHGGYGQCSGKGRFWVEDGLASNWYSGGTCERCADNTPKPINPDGPEAADLIERQSATLEAMAKAMERARPYVRDLPIMGDADLAVIETTLTQYRQGDL